MGRAQGRQLSTVAAWAVCALAPPQPANGPPTATPHPAPTPADNAAWSYAAADLVVRTKALGSDAAQISICRQAPNRRETAASCANRLDFNCDGRVSQADPQCLAFLQPLVLKPPRRVARRPSRTTSLRRRVQPGQ